MGGLPVGTFMQMGDPLPGDGRRTAPSASASKDPESSLKKTGNVRTEPRHSHPVEATTTELLYGHPDGLPPNELVQRAKLSRGVNRLLADALNCRVLLLLR